MRRAGMGYRVYDADLPDYSVAVDVYERWVHVQEYAPPPEIDEAKAAGRLAEAMRIIPEVLGATPADVFLKVRARQRGPAQYAQRATTCIEHEVHEREQTFLVNFTDYLDTGLFLPGREVRRLLGELAERAALPQPLRLHRHGQRGGRQGRCREHDDRRPERPLPGVGAAQLRRQQAQA